ncbi:MAG: shikimate kinase [Bacteroidales bacterium]|nr:shikimate kinase [Bacteroidales bacterium]
MNVYLIGYMYSGKTTLGRQLALRLGYSFVDTDQLFEEKYHTSIPLFFQRYGEEAFRVLEHQVLQSASSLSRHVIACGGGTPCHHGNMDLILANGLSVYLHMDVDDVCARMSQSRKIRPILAAKSPDERYAFVREQMAQREQYYTQAQLQFEAAGTDMKALALGLYEMVFPYLHRELLSDITSQE